MILHYTEKLSGVNAFKHLHKDSVRTIVNWDRLRSCRISLVVCTSKTKLFLPKYSKGGYRNGIPKQWKLGNNPHFVRLPAIKTRRGYLVIDGVHRLIELKPKFVVLDVLNPTAKQRKLFADLRNKFYL